MAHRTRVVVVIASLAVTGLAIGVSLWIREGFSARDQPSAIEAFVARRVRSLAVPSSMVNARNPVPFTLSVLAEARAHFADHCATCHANDGSGRTEIGQNLYPKPPDMRLPGTQALTDGEIYSIIHNGIRLTGMPAWGSEHGDLDSWRLVYFIRHLPKLTPDEIREMEALNPKSAHDREEEQEDERFLNEQPAPPLTSPKGSKEPVIKQPQRPALRSHK